MLGQNAEGVLAVEGDLASRHLVEDHAERIDVGASVDVRARALLGRHIVWRAKNLSGSGELVLCAGDFGDSKV